MELWDRNVCIDLKGKGNKMQTLLIKNHMFFSMFLTSTAFCVFINSNIFHDLKLLASFSAKNHYKSMELWDRNVCIDLKGKGNKMQTLLIKKHVFFSMFLTSTAFCVFINSNIFHDG